MGVLSCAKFFIVLRTWYMPCNCKNDTSIEHLIYQGLMTGILVAIASNLPGNIKISSKVGELPGNLKT